MGCKYVKEFDFGPQKTHVKGYMRGGYAEGGSCNYAKGGKASKPVVEKATGEKYPSRKAMVKHEAMETPRMQREEVVRKAEVRGPVRRAMPVAAREPMIPMKKGGHAKHAKHADGGPTTVSQRMSLQQDKDRESRFKSQMDRQRAVPQTARIPEMVPSDVSPSLANRMMQTPEMKKGGKMQAKIGKVMGEYKSGELHSGSSKGPVVKSRKQAIAIAMSEGRKASKR